MSGYHKVSPARWRLAEADRKKVERYEALVRELAAITKDRTCPICGGVWAEPIGDEKWVPLVAEHRNDCLWPALVALTEGDESDG